MGRGRPKHSDILTPREWEVLDLVRQRLTNEEIAERLNVSLSTVKYHVSEILWKLGVEHREEAARLALAPQRLGIAALIGSKLGRLPLAQAGKFAAVGMFLVVGAGLALLLWSVLRSTGSGELASVVSTYAGPEAPIWTGTRPASEDGRGYLDGPANQARFYEPGGVAIDGQGNVYVADSANNRLRKISPEGTVTTIPGPGERVGPTGTETGLFGGPFAIDADAAGNVYVAGYNEQVIYKVTPSGEVTAIAGNPHPERDPAASPREGPFYGLSNQPLVGSASAVWVRGTTGLAVDREGNVYIAGDQQIGDLAGRNHLVRKVTPDGQVVLVAGAEEAGYRDGRANEARFGRPWGVAVDNRGNVYVTDSGNKRVRRIAADGTVSTLAGSGIAGFKDGTAAEAQFYDPRGIAVDDRSGAVYVTDADAVRRISTDGTVTTLAGAGKGTSPIYPGYADGPGYQARFYGLFDIEVTAAGDLILADQHNHRIRKLSLRHADEVPPPPAGPGQQALLPADPENAALVPVFVHGDAEVPSSQLCEDILEQMLPASSWQTEASKVVECRVGASIGDAVTYGYEFLQGDGALYLHRAQMILLMSERPPFQPYSAACAAGSPRTSCIPRCEEVKGYLLPASSDPGDRPIASSCVLEIPPRTAAATGQIWAFLPERYLPEVLPTQPRCWQLARYYGPGGDGPVRYVTCAYP
jgi:DNA-binding beta-propeller fold protein YncE/DNA-binding CsgD family transcriptional regulator